jgi:thiol-disulfide isomerase/thioredoxin
MRSAGRRLWVVPVVAALAALGAWYSAHRRAGVPTPTIDLGNGRPKLFDFGMGVCEQCKRMEPVMERAAQELGDRVDVYVLDIRQEANEQLAERYGMRAMPLIVLAGGTSKELWRHEGYVDFSKLSRAVAGRLERP